VIEERARLSKRTHRAPLAVFLLSAVPLFVVYVVGLRSGLGVIDSGELAAVCHTLGIAHPPGYALYSLFGRLWTFLPIGSVLTRLHLASAFFSAGACGFAALAAFETIRHARKGASGWSDAPLAVLGSWAWGLTPSVWPQAVENEVYGLHVFFLTASLWLGVRLLREGVDLRARLLLAYWLGLGLSHHLSLAFALPSLALALFLQTVGGSTAASRPSKSAGRLWILPAALLVLGLSVHVYLPLRSALNPLLDWGDPTNAARWFRHATGWQYRTWLGLDLVGEKTVTHLGDLPMNLGWILPIAAIPGLFVLWKRRLGAAIYWALLFAVGILWASSYDIKDIDPYYAGSDFACMVLGAVGLGWVSLKVQGVVRRAWPVPVLTLVVALLVAVGGALRWNRSAANGPPLPDIFARSLLEGLPPNTLLMSRQWDTVVSASYYLQLVEGVREDVVIVDPELMRRSWYFPQLERRWPGLLDPVRDEVDVFLEDLALFESGQRYDAQRIESRYQNVQRSLVDAHDGKRPLASTPEVDPRLFGERVGAPFGVAVLWDPDPEEAKGRGPLPPLEPFLRGGARTDEPMSDFMRRSIASMTRGRASFLEQEGDGVGGEALRAEANRLRDWLRALQQSGPSQ
jgi:hypothetical protein